MKHIIAVFAGVVIFSCSSHKNVPGHSGSTSDSDTVITETTGSNETKAATPTKSIILNNTESAGSGETKAATPTKTIILNNTETGDKAKDPGKGKPSPSADKLSACLQKLVKQFMEEDVQNPPRKIYSYIYNGKLVYYVTPPCCDFYSDLYDSQCRLIAHPDGGITGKGDGRAKDFTQTKSGEKLVWEDERRYR